MVTTRLISVPTYVTVGVVLILLTVLTVAISFIPLQGSGHVFVGMGIAIVKATLVVLFFMHVIISSRVTWSVIAVAIFSLLLLLSLTFADFWTRYWVPYAPGH